MQKLKRNINIGFRVSEKEQEMIQKRMAQTGITTQRAYLLKMAIDGYVLQLDLKDVQECSRLLKNVSNNINQIAKHANSTGELYSTDMTKIQDDLVQIWQQQDKIIRSLAKIVEVV